MKERDGRQEDLILVGRGVGVEREKCPGRKTREEKAENEKGRMWGKEEERGEGERDGTKEKEREEKHKGPIPSETFGEYCLPGHKISDLVKKVSWSQMWSLWFSSS